MTRCSIFVYDFTPWFYMQKKKNKNKKQYDNISILLK